MRNVDVHHIAPCGGIQITSFCTERAALAFVRDEQIATYKIRIGTCVFRTAGEGAWRL